MARITSHIPVAVLPDIAFDPSRGVISLVGDNGGLSQITGEVHESSVVRGTIRIETEHGSLYLDSELEIQISEERPDTLTVDTKRDVEWHLSWSIDGSETPSTPREAAAKVWREEFNRSSAAHDDACVFDVSDPTTGETVTVDLAEERPNQD